MRIRHWMIAAITPLILVDVVPALAQDGVPGRVAQTTAGEVGSRQTRQQTAPGFEPLSRIDSRIQNRVQSRIRNRIDRYYDPQANTETPFASASDQARNAGRRKP